VNDAPDRHECLARSAAARLGWRRALRGAASAAAAGLALTAAPAAAATVFSNTAAVSIPEHATASPYPSTNAVSGLTGLLTKVEVTISGFSHTCPGDIGVLLTGPGGQGVKLFDAAGDCTAAVDLTFTFDDDASAALPTFSGLTGGTFRASSYFDSRFASPAPSGTFGTALSVFDGTNPNGTWRLFVEDFLGNDQGSISGWSLSLTAAAPPPQPEVVPLPAGAVLLLSGFGLLALRRRG
jgi:subtilisin-like proprotein convertase family protein